MCEINDADELGLTPYAVRVVGCWSAKQYVADSLAAHTTFTRLGDPTDSPVWTEQVIETEVQVFVHPGNVRKILAIWRRSTRAPRRAQRRPGLTHLPVSVRCRPR